VKTEALVIDTKENRLEVNAEKIKYIVIPLYQNGGRRHNIKFHNTSFKRGKILNIREQS
jgi:hypothetical protein